MRFAVTSWKLIVSEFSPQRGASKLALCEPVETEALHPEYQKFKIDSSRLILR
jgi:hypothetical protein